MRQGERREIGYGYAGGPERIQERIAAVCRRHRIAELAIFGSAARGEMRPDSDVELLTA